MLFCGSGLDATSREKVRAAESAAGALIDAHIDQHSDENRSCLRRPRDAFRFSACRFKHCGILACINMLNIKVLNVCNWVIVHIITSCLSGVATPGLKLARTGQGECAVKFIKAHL